MIYRIQLSRTQEETIGKMQVEARRSGDFIWFRRCAALLYRGQGYTQESVAKGLGVCI